MPGATAGLPQGAREPLTRPGCAQGRGVSPSFMLSVLFSYCCGMDYHNLCGIKQYKFTISRYRVGVSWVLCSRSHQRPYLGLKFLFQAHVAVGRICFLVLVWVVPIFLLAVDRELLSVPGGCLQSFAAWPRKAVHSMTVCLLPDHQELVSLILHFLLKGLILLIRSGPPRILCLLSNSKLTD